MPSTTSLGKGLRVSGALTVFCLAGNLIGVAEELPTANRTVAPTEIEDALTNPYMGWGLWAGSRYYDGRTFTVQYNTSGFGDDAPLLSWVLIDWMWADLEPQERRYHWQDLDAIINYWAARGKQIELRIWVTDDPGWNGSPGNEVCPEWVSKAGAHYREYLGSDKSKKRAPDYLDPSYDEVYLPKLRRFLSVLAERYDRPESPVVLWGVMGYGHYGEWHTSRFPGLWPNREVKHRVLAKIVDTYADIFRAKQLCISYAYDTDKQEVTSLEDFMYRKALDVAVSRGFALARHDFIDALHFWDRMVMEKHWRDLPMWAEGDWSCADMKNHGTHGSLEENLEVMLDWHSNFAHFYMDADSYKRAMREDRPVFERGLQNAGLGYRLALTSASWRAELPAGHILLLKQTWTNRNVGRLYKRHPLRIYLTDREGDEKFSAVDRGFDETQWVRGATYARIGIFELPDDLPAGNYEVWVALVDESGNPRIKLAIQGADGEGRYKLGEVRILPPCGSPTPCPTEIKSDSSVQVRPQGPGRRTPDSRSSVPKARRAPCFNIVAEPTWFRTSLMQVNCSAHTKLQLNSNSQIASP